jgi:hypothetical protein
MVTLIPKSHAAMEKHAHSLKEMVKATVHCPFVLHDSLITFTILFTKNQSVLIQL